MDSLLHTQFSYFEAINLRSLFRVNIALYTMLSFFQPFHYPMRVDYKNYTWLGQDWGQP